MCDREREMPFSVSTRLRKHCPFSVFNDKQLMYLFYQTHYLGASQR